MTEADSRPEMVRMEKNLFISKALDDNLKLQVTLFLLPAAFVLTKLGIGIGLPKRYFFSTKGLPVTSNMSFMLPVTVSPLSLSR